jgi:hypothetical protein
MDSVQQIEEKINNLIVRAEKINTTITDLSKLFADIDDLKLCLQTILNLSI